ncbi:Prenylcysteine lyase-domain-containing protein [Entophlyctis helioformis]|nr:Prenylcysteine lyase-domain-containing protein [Entophlyctis helioformis]
MTRALLHLATMAAAVAVAAAHEPAGLHAVGVHEAADMSALVDGRSGPLLVMQSNADPASADPFSIAAATSAAGRQGHTHRTAEQPARIVVIGAGAAGASFSYYLDKLPPSNARQVTVLERAERIGGRARIVALNVTVCDDPASGPSPSAGRQQRASASAGDGNGEGSNDMCRIEELTIELGASIFAKANHHLVNASRDLGLETQGPGQDPLADSLYASFGVWDGVDWRYLESPSSKSGWKWFGSWLSTFRLLSRYGFFNGPIQAAGIARATADAFIKIYERFGQGRPFDNVAQLVADLGIQDTVSKSAKEFMDAKGISATFTEEMLGGIVRNTYLQDVGSIRAFGGLIALYSGTEEMYNVKGGNYLIFERMLDGKDVRLNQQVTRIAKVASKAADGRPEFHVSVAGSETLVADAVVIAAPIHASGIAFDGIDVNAFPLFRYVRLYVTVVVGELNPAFFGLKERKEIPRTLLTPSPPHDNLPFHTFSINRALNATHVVVKMFSNAPLRDSHLDGMFVARGYTFAYAWDRPGSYPYLPPVETGGDSSDAGDKWRLNTVIDKDGLYYVNAFEGLVSTMETETIAGRNVAELVARQFEARQSADGL